MKKRGKGPPPCFLFKVITGMEEKIGVKDPHPGPKKLFNSPLFFKICVEKFLYIFKVSKLKGGEMG